MDATLAKKLLLKTGTAFSVMSAPDEHRVLLEGAGAVEDAGLVLVYAVSQADVVGRVPELTKILRPSARLWVAYPKARKLGTDLNRDILVGLMREHGFEPARMISIDGTWSAMWFNTR
jgi:hypothetical protein